MPQLTIKLRSLVEYPRPVVAITRQYSGGEKKKKKGTGLPGKNFPFSLSKYSLPPQLASRKSGLRLETGWKFSYWLK